MPSYEVKITAIVEAYEIFYPQEVVAAFVTYGPTELVRIQVHETSDE